MKIENSKLKIVFFGTTDFAIPALNSLVNFGYKLIAVVTRPDKPAGRKQVPSPSPVKKFANQRGIKVIQPATLKDDAVFEEFKSLNPDICIIAAYGKIIPKRCLDVPKYGFINMHPSLLPKYRGPSPIQTTILNGETETGVTIMVVDKEMDHGPILENRKWKIESGKYHKELEKELAELVAELLIETLPKYVSGEIKAEPQDHSQATFTKMFSRESGRINWSESAEKIYNQIRALNPEPGTWTILRSSGASEGQAKIINIKKAELVNGKLQIRVIQMEGKKEMTFQEFLNGHPDFDVSQLN